jgi:hypothetical protein
MQGSAQAIYSMNGIHISETCDMLPQLLLLWGLQSFLRDRAGRCGRADRPTAACQQEPYVMRSLTCILKEEPGHRAALAMPRGEPLSVRILNTVFLQQQHTRQLHDPTSTGSISKAAETCSCWRRGQAQLQLLSRLLVESDRFGREHVHQRGKAEAG